MKIPPLLRILPFFCCAAGAVAESLAPLAGDKVPENLDELWAGYDPRSEALESEVPLEWEQEGLVCRVIRYRIGTFKGQPSVMAAFYAFPKGATRLPAILQIHGGGQSASLSAAVTAAKRGFACLSLNWGGNPMTLADGSVYRGPNTDWGALDATHPPQRTKSNHFAGGTAPDAYTLDPVDSPRNDNWFLVTLGARRALTFLERQPEVDPGRLGVTGHSMGGRLSVQLTGIDFRVKAAVPSCGGSGDFSGDPDLFAGGPLTKRSARDLATRSENPYIERLRVPTLWFSPTNDFHAHMDHFAYAWRNVPDALLGLSISPHFNHRHSDAHSLSAALWFEEHLKGAFRLPRTPDFRLGSPAPGGAAVFTVVPDSSSLVREVRVYATTDSHALTRFWRTVPVTKAGSLWTAEVPVLTEGEPLFAYADVLYEAPEAYRKIPNPPGVGASDTFAVSSRVVALTGARVKAAGIRPSAKRERSIDAGDCGWQDWFRLNWGNSTLWTATTRKIKDPIWRGPEGARLAFEINPANDTILYVTLTQNAWGAFGAGGGEYYAPVPLKANGGWIEVNVGLEDFLPMKGKQTLPLKDWSTLTDLGLHGHASLEKDGVSVAQPSVAWKNASAIRVRNLRWVGGNYRGDASVAAELSEAERTRAFNDAIKASLEQEAKDRAQAPKKAN